MTETKEALNPTQSPNLKAVLEALLFAAPGSVTPGQLSAAIGITPTEVEIGLRELSEYYIENGSGLCVQWHAGRIQLTTTAEMGGIVEKFLGLEATSRLSKAALESLAIVAYKQPVTRPQLDAIRGVSSDGVVKSLLSKDLIQEVGRAEGPGRPIMYGTTAEFLQYFGLKSIQDLPPLESFGETPAEHKDILKE